MRAPIGARIGARRKAMKLGQGELARAVGISPSYLNLIEANKRQVAGALLLRIAGQLAMDIADLTGEAEHRLIHEVEEALSDPILGRAGIDIGAARDLVAERPDIAAVVARLHRAYADATANAETYATRLRADPMLAELLHQVLSGLTAIRAGAEILADVPDLSEAERQTFVGTIGQETRAMTVVAQTLIGQFDRASQTARSISPRRELDDVIFASDNFFPVLEDAAERVRNTLGASVPFDETEMASALKKRFDISVERGVLGQRDANGFPGQYGFDSASKTLWFQNSTTLATRRFQMVRLYAELSEPEALETMVQSPMLTSPTAKRLAHGAMSSYLAGGITFPYRRFLTDAEALRYDIEALRERYGASFEQVAHRLVTLRKPGASGVPFGFLRADPAGRLTKHFPLPGLLLPNSGHACPLWAIYGAFRQPGSLVRQAVRFPDGSRYLFVAQTVSRRLSSFADQALPTSILLACDVLHADRTIYATGMNLSDASADIPVGPTCRLCTRRDCPSRQEEALMPGERDVPVRAPLLPKRFELGD